MCVEVEPLFSQWEQPEMQKKRGQIQMISHCIPTLENVDFATCDSRMDGAGKGDLLSYINRWKLFPKAKSTRENVKIELK